MNKQQAAMIRCIMDDPRFREDVYSATIAYAQRKSKESEIAAHQKAIAELFTFIACHGLDYVAK
jgi:hypothetical protein